MHIMSLRQLCSIFYQPIIGLLDQFSTYTVQLQPLIPDDSFTVRDLSRSYETSGQGGA